MNKIIFLILFVFTSIACGAPVSATLNSISVATDTISITQIPTKASTDVNMVVCNSYGLHVRPAAGDFTTYDRTLEDGDSVTVILSTRTVTEDMALWYELADGGWVNGKYLCEVE